MTKLTIPQIQNLLVSALEGGSNYWYRIEAHDLPAGRVKEEDFHEGGKLTNPNDYFHPEEIVPVTPRCASLIVDAFEDHKIGVWVNRRALQQAWTLMRDKQPRHAAAVIEENDDSITADVFLQLAVYGEVVYG